jgi:5-formyltetrahydrofolate cyclo-ligase
VYMAVPRLAEERPFILLDPERLDLPPRRAASITGATRAGRRVGVEGLRPVDLVVCGSVAVNRQGARVGKGGGFSDLEFALPVAAGLIGTTPCWPPPSTRYRCWPRRCQRPRTTSAWT